MGGLGLKFALKTSHINRVVKRYVSPRTILNIQTRLQTFMQKSIEGEWIASNQLNVRGEPDPPARRFYFYVRMFFLVSWNPEHVIGDTTKKHSGSRSLQNHVSLLYSSTLLGDT